jgi:hypothetical protein
MSALSLPVSRFVRAFYGLALCVGLVVGGGLLSGPAFAADPTKHHDHNGIVAAYKGAPPKVTLSEADEAKLASGQMVQKQVQTGNGGHAVAFMNINATPEKVWSKITAFNMYPSWVDNVQKCTAYSKSGSLIYVDFALSVMGIGVEYYVRHDYQPALGYLTWTLDYTRQSDLDDSVGYWRVTALSPTQTRLEYSVDIRFKGWIPGFAQEMISSKGLTTATSWVKKQSES